VRSTRTAVSCALTVIAPNHLDVAAGPVANLIAVADGARPVDVKLPMDSSALARQATTATADGVVRISEIRTAGAACPTLWAVAP
jgi:hypothetical protein